MEKGASLMLTTVSCTWTNSEVWAEVHESEASVDDNDGNDDAYAFKAASPSSLLSQMIMEKLSPPT